MAQRKAKSKSKVTQYQQLSKSAAINWKNCDGNQTIQPAIPAGFCWLRKYGDRSFVRFFS